MSSRTLIAAAIRMSTYSLSGSGIQLLTAGTTALHVSITTLSPFGGIGNANPPNHYHQALLRPGDGTGFWAPIPVEGGPQWIGLPNGTDRIGYACEGGAAISVVEVIGGTSPFAGPAGSPGAPGAAGAPGATGPPGPGGALTLISSQAIAGSSVASVTFSTIPNTYTHLWLWFVCRATGANTYQTLRLRFNSDSGTNYIDVLDDSTGVLTQNPTSAIPASYISGGGAVANYAGFGQILVPNYAATTFFKGAVNLSAMQDGLNRTMRHSGTWKSTAAVTDIALLLDANEIAVGSVFSLYGVS